MIRILSVVESFTRECLVLEADASLGSGRVTRELDRMVVHSGDGPAELLAANYHYSFREVVMRVHPQNPPDKKCIETSREISGHSRLQLGE